MYDPAPSGREILHILGRSYPVSRLPMNEAYVPSRLVYLCLARSILQTPHNIFRHYDATDVFPSKYPRGEWFYRVTLGRCAAAVVWPRPGQVISYISFVLLFTRSCFTLRAFHGERNILHYKNCTYLPYKTDSLSPLRFELRNRRLKRSKALSRRSLGPSYALVARQ